MRPGTKGRLGCSGGFIFLSGVPNSFLGMGVAASLALTHIILHVA